MIEQGLSAKPMVKIVKTKSTEVYSYRESLKTNVIYNIDKLFKIYKIVIENKDKKIMIVSDFIAHGHLISRILNRFQIKNIFMHSGIEKRKEKFEMFATGKIDIIISTNLIEEGVDIKDIDVVVLAFPRKNYRQVLQRIGRGLRVTEGKTEVTIYDFLDEEDKYLKNHFHRRLKYYRQELFEWTIEEIFPDKEDESKYIPIIETECLQEINEMAKKTVEELKTQSDSDDTQVE
jgi:superfamily II DNA or RNA helicase